MRTLVLETGPILWNVNIHEGCCLFGVKLTKQRQQISDSEICYKSVIFVNRHVVWILHKAKFPRHKKKVFKQMCKANIVSQETFRKMWQKKNSKNKEEGVWINTSLVNRCKFVVMINIGMLLKWWIPEPRFLSQNHFFYTPY